MGPEADIAAVSSSAGSKAAGNWITKKKAAHLHPALGVNSTYDAQRARLTPKSSFDEENIDAHTDHFKEVLRIYSEHAETPAIVEFDIRNTYTWDQVLAEARLAEAAYVKAGGNVFRKLGRSVGDHGPTINQYLRLLPEGEYSSILCGGLKLMFSAAAHMSELRRNIWEALRDVPYTITKAERCLERHAGDSELKDLATELYLSILTAIEGMTIWLVKKGGWKQIKALFKGPMYEKDLEVKINQMQARLQTLQYRANELQADAVASTHKRTRRMEPKVENIEQKTEEMTDSFANFNTEWQAEQAFTKEMWQITAAEYEANKTEREESRRERQLRRQEREKNEKGAEAQSGLLDVLVGLVQNSEWVTKDDLIKSLKASHAKGLISTDELIYILAIDPEGLLKDIDNTNRASYDLTPASRGRADWLMQSPVFQNWLTSRNPGILIVDENDPSAVAERTSALSIFCATLSRALGKSSSASHLEFFCGLHTKSTDPLRGPQGIIRALISQLLTRARMPADWDLSRIAKTRTSIGRLERFELDHLLSAFSDLVRQLPFGTFLFVLIDGLSFYERSDLLPYTQFLLRKLLELTQEEDVSAVVKVLVTGPTVGRRLSSLVPPQDRLTLPPEVGPGAGGEMIHERAFMMESRRAMRMSLNPRGGGLRGPPRVTTSRSYGDYDYDDYDDEYEDKNEYEISDGEETMVDEEDVAEKAGVGTEKVAAT